MTFHREKKFLPFTPDELLKIVSDIESYPLFLPWISNTKIYSNKSSPDNALLTLDAEVSIKFKLIREKFRSKVIIDKRRKIITTTNIDGPFKMLNNQWLFVETENGCDVIFEVEFQFKSIILHNLINSMFRKAMAKVVLSFESRAKDLYD